jgi:DNA-binding winged helix-turn-helix (wHTH) protein
MGYDRPAASAMRVQFDRFVVDFDQRRLFAGAQEIKLAPKSFNLLMLLITERPKALSKQEILERLWPGTFVTENNLATLISDLREALEDQAQEPRFIRTVYSYGYSFVGDASDDSPVRAQADVPSGWRLIHADREIALQLGANILGRSGDGVIVLDSPTISRHHARLSIAGGRATIEDLGSKNGTWIGAQAVTAPAALKNGDELRLGSVVVVVRFSPSAASTETVATTRVKP